MKIDTPVNGYDIDVMVVGYPGKTVCHGGLGWSTIVLLRGHGRVAMIDTGGMGVRRLLLERLKERGLKPEDVTDLLLFTRPLRPHAELDDGLPRPYRHRLP